MFFSYISQIIIFGFTYDTATEKYTKIDDFEIKGYGSTGSSAQHAEYHSFKYIDHLAEYWEDVDNDKEVSILDAASIQRWLADIISDDELYLN